ncbi:MAG: hypothetical protein EPO35_03655 [Acidobacteria bacterium]|nr:MAG: hypothetical protein EPO35_03655 [Acidobacteriota bacterium]
MVRKLLSVGVLAAMFVFASVPAFAQGSSTSSIAGTVIDSTGAAIPGASIEAKNAATGAVFTAVSSGQGGFQIPAVPTGTYTVTVTLQGFKTVILKDVVVTVGQPATVSAKLEVGGVSETVTVEGAAAVVQTQQTAITSTINTKSIMSLPLTSRNPIDFLTFLPGVNVAGTNRQANVNGLPGSAVNITLDGINIQDNTLKSTDGFFTIVQPRLDAIEEVSITGAAAGATDGQGAITVKFVTKSGTNTYTGSGYNYFRSDKLNENTWFNKRNGVAKAKLKQNQTGGTIGGPISIPGLFSGRNRAFFFTNIENFNQPSQLTRRRTILNPAAQAGTFRYTSSTGVREVNLLTLAAANGQLNSIDPTISKLLSDIRTAASSTGSITDQTDPLYQDFNYNVDQKSNNWFPTFKVDLNFTSNHRLSAVYNHDLFNTKPDAATNGFDPTFPGFPDFGSQTSERRALSTKVRSTIGRNLVNEATFGFQSSPVQFFPEQKTAAPWTGSLANQKGFQLGISAAGITNAGPAPNAQSRNVNTFIYEDTLNWQKGNHSIALGASVSDFHIWLQNITAVPSITFGLTTADTARTMFTTANFPGAATADLNRAQSLYAVLTGRISQITGNARIDESTGNYAYQGSATQRGRMIEAGFYVQDAWRLRPNLTINYGLRYELQGPFTASNSLYSFATAADAFGRSGLRSGCDADEPTAQTCNIFSATLSGTAPTFQKLEKGSKAYNTDYNNFAPSIGVNWTPTSSNPLLSKIMGEAGQFSLRGGWTRAYTRNGLSDFTGVYNSNPGIRITVNRSEGLGNLGATPLLLRNDSQLGPASFPTAPVYPMSGLITDSINVFAPNVKVPYADTYTVGVQRGISKNMAVEVRYVGTRSRDSIVNYDLNETNIIENGFLNEFRNAQANLQANIAAGRGATFKYFGAGTGTSPLPIYLAYFSGVTAANASNAALYTSTSFANTTFVNRLAKYNPNPFAAAGDLGGANSTLRGNALTAGLPANFFFANPDYLGGARITGNGGFTRFNSIQLELRRRLANGFQFNANYVYGVGYGSNRYSFRVARKESRNTGTGGDVPHAVKANLVLDLPFGKGRRFGGSAGEILDRIIGGWQINLNTRIQSGRLLDFGNVRMVGFDAKELRSMFKLRHDSTDGTDRIYVLPADLISESIKAFSVSATSATGYGSLGAPSGKYFAPANGPDCIESISNNYGDCGVRTLIVQGPILKETDLSIVKTLKLIGKARAEFHVEALNVFNTVNFVPVGGVGSTTLSGYEVGGLTGINTARVVQLVSRITW